MKWFKKTGLSRNLTKKLEKIEKDWDRIPEKIRKEILDDIEKQLYEQRDILIKSANKTKEKAINGILILDSIYELEDDEGISYTRERLNKHTHAEILELLEGYIKEFEMMMGEKQ